MSEAFVWSDESKSEFDRNGFLVIRGGADPKLCDAIREISEVHLRYRVAPVEMEAEFAGSDRPEYWETVRRLRQVYDRDILYRRWIGEPALRPILADLLEAEPILVTAHHNSLMSKMPHHSTETRWHRDRRYWHYRDDRLISIWLALGEENLENGALAFIPGSHRADFAPESFDSEGYFREEFPDNRSWIERSVQMELHKGDVVFFHCELLHRAGPNRTQTPKLSLVYTVKAAGNKAIPGTRSAAYREIPLRKVDG
jgi:phytanoyl-CoA hydroxylase